VKRLCFGSCIKVLVHCKSVAGKSQKNICSSIILSFAPDYFIGNDTTNTSDWAICRKSLPSDVVAEAKKIVEQDDKTALREIFKKSIVPLINDNKKSDIVLALKDIIANDTEIKPDTVVDKVTGLTKAEIGAANSFVFEDFLAGVFLYAVTVVENIAGKVAIGTLNENYMSQFEGCDSEVQFVDDISMISPMAQTVPLVDEPSDEVAPEKPKTSDLVELFEKAIDMYGIANFVDTDFTAMTLKMDWVCDVDDFVTHLRRSVFPLFRHISREAIYGYCIEFANVISAYNGYMGLKMSISDDGERAIWLPSAGYEINEETLNYRRELNRLYGLISDGGTLSVYGYTNADDHETTEETHNYKDNTADTNGQTINNTAFVFQQYGTDNKQIVGNIETLIINNKGE